MWWCMQADVLAKDVDGQTPCDVARKNSHTEVVSLLTSVS